MNLKGIPQDVRCRNKLQILAKKSNLSEGVLLKTMIDYFWDNFRDLNFRKDLKLWDHEAEIKKSEGR